MEGSKFGLVPRKERRNEDLVGKKEDWFGKREEQGKKIGFVRRKEGRKEDWFGKKEGRKERKLVR